MEVPQMRVLVTGASGAVGAHLVPHLIHRGHQVVATSRSVERLERLTKLGAEAVALDGLDQLRSAKRSRVPSLTGSRMWRP